MPKMVIDASIQTARHQVDSETRSAASLIRRMTVRLTSGAFWQAVGHLLLDGKTEEAAEAEVFSGIGFYARPHQSANVEAIVAHPGGAQNPVIIATRDEGLRKEMANIGHDTAAMFNTLATVRIVGATIEARTKDGAAVELAKASELNDLRAFVAANMAAAGHSHAAPGGATTSVVAIGTIPTTAYPGTSALKGE
jgi:hypothetical protein